ncbi:MAG: hypothetical protein DWB56_08410 [Candidatus Jettenia sp.]|uniref:Uncharacterized protein n=1 Tax=Candidatus Jettenia caeni TaxID=247490 RepID=I3IPX8_9BACT|nr:MAG: hypothetical protein EDM77_05380 [Candidatus Jettenia sp. AMX1]MBC6928965.1 hypothetical protein [Candidatus Jettenia sp.]MCE7880900.1 hypothetical protein [Candidatus Jettenia sp. AMX1]MCQ3926990.1 hypothetical protein [Candidatus Jettenia sp.]GAB63773.1 hypothetical protein KSU1_D0464 [Candidatus Jettenia caeni]
MKTPQRFTLCDSLGGKAGIRNKAKIIRKYRKGLLLKNKRINRGQCILIGRVGKKCILVRTMRNPS